MPIQKQIFGFEVAIDDVHRMQIVERKSYFGGVEFSYRIGESL